MTKYFYSHLISFQSLEAELDTLEISPSEKKELLELAHTHLHQQVTDTILSQLGEEDKKKFLEYLAFGQDEKVWEHLNQKVEKIEDKITQTAEEIKKDLAEDIRSLKAKSRG